MFLEKLAALLLGDLLKKKPWALWAIKMNDKKWVLIGKGSKRRLRMYERTLIAEGWRTIIIGKDIVPVPPPVLLRDSIGE